MSYVRHHHDQQEDDVGGGVEAAQEGADEALEDWDNQTWFGHKN